MGERDSFPPEITKPDNRSPMEQVLDEVKGARADSKDAKLAAERSANCAMETNETVKAIKLELKSIDRRLTVVEINRGPLPALAFLLAVIAIVVALYQRL
jgi:hypothetical protein